MGSVGGGNTPRTLPDAQQKTLNQIIQRTKNLKKEQSRIVDPDGNILITKQGKEHEVYYTVGEKREYMMGNIPIHNHPDGGTFSSADLRDFGFGATDIIVAAPEGVYRLSANDITGNNSHGEWVKMQDALDKQSFNDRSYIDLRTEAQKAPHIKSMMDKMESISNEWVKQRDAGANQETLNKLGNQYDTTYKEYKAALDKEIRRVEVAPHHEWFTQNAKKYGYTYTFTPHKTRKK